MIWVWLCYIIVAHENNQKEQNFYSQVGLTSALDTIFLPGVSSGGKYHGHNDYGDHHAGWPITSVGLYRMVIWLMLGLEMLRKWTSFKIIQYL